MSRKFVLSLATATILVAGLASTAADARGGFGGGGMGGGRSFAAARLGGGNHFSARSGHAHLATLTGGRGGRGGNPGGGNPGGGHGHLHHHHHWIFRDGIWIDGGYVEEFDGVPDVAAVPGPCTCLTKTYTPTGLVIFADVCTKEAASARVDGTTADVNPIPPAEGKASDATPTTPGAPADAKSADMTNVPTSPNYAGRTFADYLAANPQLTAQAPKN